LLHRPSLLHHRGQQHWMPPQSHRRHHRQHLHCL